MELFAADGHDAGGCERVTGKSGMRPRGPMMGPRTWKSFDWDAMEYLHRKGLISDPVSKAKSVMLTDTGLRRAEAAFRRLFEADE